LLTASSETVRAGDRDYPPLPLEWHW